MDINNPQVHAELTQPFDRYQHKPRHNRLCWVSRRFPPLGYTRCLKEDVENVVEFQKNSIAADEDPA